MNQDTISISCNPAVNDPDNNPGSHSPKETPVVNENNIQYIHQAPWVLHNISIVQIFTLTFFFFIEWTTWGKNDAPAINEAPMEEIHDITLNQMGLATLEALEPTVGPQTFIVLVIIITIDETEITILITI